ncbi:uncharacterized protein AB675_12045 [Cyphellophora attinorum]|uniref:Uncharacterized protein n=1 Tax=Cyphellophora attinorum TaxID=1664694 RepID=A0A0N1H8U2_9EURO|nr:uncharacterized protein AB675_12045 [Phialophora attinorum]KPI38433.1 hypothetical protein AB675_12045 [Phialophora attinorum]
MTKPHHTRTDQELTELDAPRPAHEEAAFNQFEGRDANNSDNDVSETFDSSSLDDQQRRAEQASSDEAAGAQKPEQQENETFNPRLTNLYTISWLIFFSFWGTLARLGVEAITLYPNSPFTSRVLWANLGGSFFIGFLTEDRKLFQQEWGSSGPTKDHAAHVKVKKTIPLYIGLATGFCGCFTSFSSFMKDSFLAMANGLDSASPTTPYESAGAIASRNGGYSFLALLAILIVEPSVSISALKAGAHFALLLEPVTPTLPFRFFRKAIDPLAVVLAFGCWFAAVLMSIWPAGDKTHWRFRATFPLIFSPLGCLSRYYLSKYLNARIPSFPLGTFVANIAGTIVLGMAWDLQHATGIGASPGASINGCAILEGIIEGFCGCLTTVSTWVLELDALRRRHAWLYGLCSASVGLAFLIVIMGSMAWTVGFASPACS